MKLLYSSRIRRKTADLSTVDIFGFDRDHFVCQRVMAGLIPQHHLTPAYHFRTPSPDGQQFSQLLSVFLFVSKCARDPARVRRHIAVSAHSRGGALQNPPCLLSVKFTTQTTSEGIQQCVLRQPLSVLSPLLVWPPVVTRSANRRFMAGRPARAQRPCWTATSRQARPSARRATFFIANAIRIAADARHPINKLQTAVVPELACGGFAFKHRQKGT